MKPNFRYYITFKADNYIDKMKIYNSNCWFSKNLLAITHSFIHSHMQPLSHSATQPLSQLTTQPLTHSLTHWLIQSLTRSLTHLHTRSLTHCLKLWQCTIIFPDIVDTYLSISFPILSNFYPNFICHFFGMSNLKCLSGILTASWWNYTNNFIPVNFCYSNCW